MNGQSVILLPNRFDYSFHNEFQSKCIGAIDDREVKEIIFDFSRVEYVDSAALGMMMMWQRRSAAASKKMIIRGAKGATEQILNMANMHRIFDFI